MADFKSFTTARLSLIDLPGDVLLELFAWLSVHHLKILSLTHSTFRRLVRRKLLRKMHIDLNDEATQSVQRAFNTMVEDELCGAVQSLTVRDTSSPRLLNLRGQVLYHGTTELYEEVDIRITSVCRALRFMHGLDLLEWHAKNDIPCTILETLSTCLPKTRLSVHVRTASEENDISARKAGFSLLERLKRQPNLHTICLQGDHVREQDCRPYVQAIGQVVDLTPSMKLLKLDLHLEDYFDDRPSLTAQIRVPEEGQLPVLETLHIPMYEAVHWNHYSFLNEVVDCIGGVLKHEPLLPHCSTMDIFDSFDWSHIRSLDDPNVALVVAHKMTELKEIVFGCYWPDALVTFCERLPPTVGLETISTWTTNSASRNTILKHGRTIKKLSIHHPGDASDVWDPRCVNDEYLLQIRSECPKLEDLELSFDISKARWPNTTFEIMAGFRRLRKLTAWFDKGFERGARVDFTMVAALFRGLIDNGSGLDELIVHVGRPCRATSTLVRNTCSSHEFYTHCTSSASYRCIFIDDATGKAFRTTCTRVGDAENLWMGHRVGQPCHVSPEILSMSLKKLSKYLALTPNEEADFARVAGP